MRHPGAPGASRYRSIDVIRAAIAEVEDYRRVSVLTAAEDAVVGPAVADMIHLLAELIENATLYSPSGTQVEIRAGRVANGFAIEIDDRGLGIEPDQLREINQQLASPPDFDLADADRLGLFVGAKLAAKHGVRVSLRPSPYGGTSAIVLMPNSIVAPGVFSQAGLRPDGEPQPGARPVAGRSARLDLAGTAALALTGRRAAEPPQPARQPAAAALPAALDRPAAIPAWTARPSRPWTAARGPSRPWTIRGAPRRPRPSRASRAHRGRPRGPARGRGPRHACRAAAAHPAGEPVSAPAGPAPGAGGPPGAAPDGPHPGTSPRPRGFGAECVAAQPCDQTETWPPPASGRPPRPDPAGEPQAGELAGQEASRAAGPTPDAQQRGGPMSDQGAASPERDLGWLLDDLAARVDQFRQAVILSRDGLVIAASRDLSREDAEHMAALAAGLQSLARGAGEHYGVGAVRQCVIELEQALLFVTSAGHGSCLAVLCPADADAGLVAYEMAMLVKRAGPHLAARPRFRTIHSPAG